MVPNILKNTKNQNLNKYNIIIEEKYGDDHAR